MTPNPQLPDNVPPQAGRSIPDNHIVDANISHPSAITLGGGKKTYDGPLGAVPMPVVLADGTPPSRLGRNAPTPFMESDSNHTELDGQLQIALNDAQSKQTTLAPNGQWPETPSPSVTTALDQLELNVAPQMDGEANEPVSLTENPSELTDEPLINSFSEVANLSAPEQEIQNIEQLRSLSAVFNELFSEKVETGRSNAEVMADAFQDPQNWNSLKAMMFESKETADPVAQDRQLMGELAAGGYTEAAGILKAAFDAIGHLDNTVAVFYKGETKRGDQKAVGDHRLLPGELNSDQYEATYPDRLQQFTNNLEVICKLAGIDLTGEVNSDRLIESMFRMRDASVYGVGPLNLAKFATTRNNS